MNAIGVYTRPERYALVQCPRCKKAHEFTLAVTASKRLATFGGPSPGRRQFDVAFECPTTKEIFDQSVTLAESPNETLQAVAVATGPIAPPEWLRDEQAEWLKNSATTARSFTQAMLSASLGAIPVYFAVVNYVASHHHQVSAWIGVIPPVAFIVAAACYAFALRPAFGRIGDDEEFLAFRDKRLSELDQRITAASVVFAAALAVTVVVFALSLYRS